MASYLVTGGAGFVGSHLVDALLNQGHQVVVLDDLSTGKKENIDIRAKLHIGDIRSLEDVAKAIEGCAGVYHLAAIASVSKSLKEWAHTNSVNQMGAVMVMEQAAKCSIPVVYASSAAIYGDNNRLPLTESEHPQPLSPYGLDKLACEWQAAMGAQCLNLHSIGARFFNVYGPRQDPKSPYSGVISIFMEKLKNGQPLTIFGDGEQSRDFIYVGDVVAYLLAAMRELHSGHSNAEVVNICTGKQTSIKELAILLRDTSGRETEILHAAPRQGDIRHSCGNPEKASRLLCTHAVVNLREGLEKTWLSAC